VTCQKSVRIKCTRNYYTKPLLNVFSSFETMSLNLLLGRMKVFDINDQLKSLIPSHFVSAAGCCFHAVPGQWPHCGAQESVKRIVAWIYVVKYVIISRFFNILSSFIKYFFAFLVELFRVEECVCWTVLIKFNEFIQKREVASHKFLISQNFVYQHNSFYQFLPLRDVRLNTPVLHLVKCDPESCDRSRDCADCEDQCQPRNECRSALRQKQVLEFQERCYSSEKNGAECNEGNRHDPASIFFQTHLPLIEFSSRFQPMEVSHG